MNCIFYITQIVADKTQSTINSTLHHHNRASQSLLAVGWSISDPVRHRQIHPSLSGKWLHAGRDLLMSGCSCVWLQFTGNSILFISTKSEHVHPMPSPPTGPYVRLEVRTIASIITARAMIKAYTAFFFARQCVCCNWHWNGENQYQRKGKGVCVAKPGARFGSINRDLYRVLHTSAQRDDAFLTTTQQKEHARFAPSGVIFLFTLP